MRMVKFVLLVCMIAALAGSVMAQIAVSPTDRAISVYGIITSVNLDKRAIVLGPVNATEVRPPITILVNDKTKIFKNDKVVGLDGLSVGDRCRGLVVKTSEGTLLALYVWAFTQVPHPQYACGIIDKVNYDTGIFYLKLPDLPLAPGPVMMFVAGDTTKIIKNGQPATFKALLAGDMAVVSFMPPPPTASPVNLLIPALSIEAKTPPQIVAHAGGKIVGIDKLNHIISVLPPAITSVDGALKFKVSDRTVIDKFGTRSFDTLCVEDTVDVAYNPQLDVAIPIAINITVSPKLYNGYVTQVDLLAGTVAAQQSPMGPVILFRVVPDTRILKNGQLATLKSIMPKDLVEIRFFRFSDGIVAQNISAKSPITTR